MARWVTKENRRRRRHLRVRRKISGQAGRPRLTVYRSLKEIYAQIIDDDAGRTLVSASTLMKDVRSRANGAKTRAEKSRIVGRVIAEKAKEAGITRVAFDRGGYLYHGRVRALAEGAREAGLEF